MPSPKAASVDWTLVHVVEIHLQGVLDHLRTFIPFPEADPLLGQPLLAARETLSLLLPPLSQEALDAAAVAALTPARAADAWLLAHGYAPYGLVYPQPPRSRRARRRRLPVIAPLA